MVETQIKNFTLKIIFVVHLILMTWGSQGYWSAESYLFINLVFLVILLWGMHAADNPEPIQLALFVNAVCVVMDVILLSVRFPSNSTSERFSAFMAILNLIARPFSTIVLYRIMQERNGTIGTSNLFGGASRSYEDIDRPVIHSVPQTETSHHGSYDFSTSGAGFGQPDKKMPPPYNGTQNMDMGEQITKVFLQNCIEN